MAPVKVLKKVAVEVPACQKYSMLDPPGDPGADGHRTVLSAQPALIMLIHDPLPLVFAL
jgi:hypothetical protein